MGLSASRMGSAPSHGPGPPQRRRPTPKRRISSLLVCGAASSSREMEDCPAELLLNSAELQDGKKLKKYRGNGSDLSIGSRGALDNFQTENWVSSGRCPANDIPVPEPSSSNVAPGDGGKCLSDSRELVPCQSMVIASVNDTASTSCTDPPLPNCVHATEVVNLDTMKDINSSMNEDPSETIEVSSNSNSVPFHGTREYFFDEVPVENNVAEAPDFSDSEYSSFSVVSDSPTEFHLMRDDSLQEVIPPAVGFLVSEREQNRQERGLIQRDVMGVSSNTLSSSSAEGSSYDIRRNSRRLFWDAFSRRTPGIDSFSRGFLFSSNENLRSQDRLLLDFDGDFLSNERRGDTGSRGSRTQGSSEQRRNPRSEMWERLREGLGSTDLLTAVCPRRIHADGSCSCQSGLPAEESGSRAISRIVLLAQALSEVLDHIHRPPTSLSMSTASLPAAESVIDSFPVKIHRKDIILECAEDVSQCYICLADYEEGDKIRVLPCHHEYHMSCVDKWLKEIHGVCPLCRRYVCDGFTEASASNQDIISH
ncbi:hypothetical protein ACS0TY_024663 [Phlomoides rotata]